MTYLIVTKNTQAAIDGLVGYSPVYSAPNILLWIVQVAQNQISRDWAGFPDQIAYILLNV